MTSVNAETKYIMTIHNISRLSIALFLCLVALLGGCAVKGSGQPFTIQSPQEGKALVYHYRVHHAFLGSALSWDVLSNGEPLTRIGNGGYFAETLSPGHVSYLTRTNRDAGVYGIASTALSNALATFHESYEFEAQADKTYYLQWRFGASMKHPIIESKDRKTALEEMEGLLAFPPLTVDPER